MLVTPSVASKVTRRNRARKKPQNPELVLVLGTSESAPQCCAFRTVLASSGTEALRIRFRAGKPQSVFGLLFPTAVLSACQGERSERQKSLISDFYITATW